MSLSLDVQQILTQIAGFLVLVWLLRRFAWPALFEVLEARREKIAADFDERNRMKAEFARLEEEYKGRLAESEAHARQRLLEAIEEGRRIGNEIEKKARADAEKTIEKARQHLEVEVAAAWAQQQDQVIEIVLQVAERVIQERLDEPKHRQLVAGFIRDVERV